MNDVLVIGTVALDTIETPFGKVEKALGGSATYASVAASYFARPGIVAVVALIAHMQSFRQQRAQVDARLAGGECVTDLRGKLAIHPKHIPILEAAFMPTPEEIEHARALITAHDEHQKKGSGVFAFEGKMIDMPVVRAAENILKRAGKQGSTG